MNLRDLAFGQAELNKMIFYKRIYNIEKQQIFLYSKLV